MSLGLNVGSSGTYRLSGSGLLTVLNGETIGGSGSGCFTQAGGTQTVSGGLVLAQGTASTGTYNLNGGLLNLSGLAQGGGAATFNFSGGTFQAGADFSTSVPIVLSTAGGAPGAPACGSWVGGVFDSNGNTLTLDGGLSGPGGLEKVGAGMLILSGENTYGGGTIVTSGTLERGQQFGPPRRFELDRRGKCPVNLRRRRPRRARGAGTDHVGPARCRAMECGNLLPLSSAEGLWSATACRRFSKRHASSLTPPF